ncbi:MAG TPA: hypothetical protein EYG95_02650, partial [Campylobacterales bacterium]|nr:hypothetical protein [Campylobacterales bacterium]
MRSENYVAFFTVCGFFIGLIFSIVKVDTITDLFLYTLSITLFFHMFIHVVLVYFTQANEIFDVSFDKNEHEELANMQILELKEREDQITALLKSINDFTPNEIEGV